MRFTYDTENSLSGTIGGNGAAIIYPSERNTKWLKDILPWKLEAVEHQMICCRNDEHSMLANM